MAKLIQKWEDIDARPKLGNVVYRVGMFLSYDQLGHIIPAESASLYGYATPILGVCLQDILLSDDNIASSTLKVPFQYAATYKFRVPVSAGTPVASMVGQTFDVDGVDPRAIDLSAPGLQLRVTSIIHETEVEVEVAAVVIEG